MFSCYHKDERIGKISLTVFDLFKSPTTHLQDAFWRWNL